MEIGLFKVFSKSSLIYTALGTRLFRINSKILNNFIKGFFIEFIFVTLETFSKIKPS